MRVLWMRLCLLLGLGAAACGVDANRGVPPGCENVQCEAHQECKVDADNNVAYCEDSCDNYDCRRGTVCELQEVVCVTAPCPPRARCVPDPCNAVKCADYQDCEVDALTGDAYCADTCDGYPCEPDATCELQEIACVTSPCPPKAVCVPAPCSTVQCAEHQTCEIDPGSGKAFCQDTCTGFDCPMGSTCVLSPVSCVSTPCPPVATCETDPCTQLQCEAHQVCEVDGTSGAAYCADTCDQFPCPSGHSCVLSQPVCVTSPCPPVAECVPTDPCAQPIEQGPCDAVVPRFAFNAGTESCEAFTYGGCGGNGNNFATLGDCQETCSVPACEQPIVAGECAALIPRWAFNETTGTCERFMYSGCGGNANNYRTRAECQGACAELDRCAQAQDPGDCAAAIQRWSFNETTDACEAFIYTGCNGNANNFTTLEACEGACAPSDLCSLPAVRGPCQAYIPSWHFNDESGQCESFIYGGCGGNANRFDTQSDCEAQCSARDTCELAPDRGPCDAVIPRWYRDPDSGQCERFFYGGCGGNSNNFVTKADCEAACPPADPCTLPTEQGPCNAVIPRWGFNDTSGMCEEFTYGGCGANANNFPTEAECLEACDTVDPCTLPLDQGPCHAAIPRWHFDETTGQCERFIYGGCAGNGNNFATLDECVGTCGRTDPCSQPVTQGPCQAVIPRWAFNEGTGMCESFNYGGCAGNENNFLTEQECLGTCGDICEDPCANISCLDHQTCEIWEPTGEGYCLDACTNFPCDPGFACELVDVACVTEPCPPVAQCVPQPCEWLNCLPHQECQLHEPTDSPYCVDTCAGFDCPDDKVCELVPVQCFTEPCPPVAMCTSPAACTEDVDPGPCLAVFPRFAFNAATGACEEFTYGGCGGNENNFTDKGACETACAIPDPCQFPPNPGTCTDSTTRWAFNTDTADCEPFNYTGCGGNPNNFDDEGTCETTCEVDPCAQPIDPGPCLGAFQRWGRDALGSCVPFIYGGCGGNANNFATKEDCEGRCIADPCTLPIEPGPCAGVISRYGFDTDNGACTRFDYSGCGGNANNFLSAAHCGRVCEGR